MKVRRRQKRDHRGFTIPELMMACFVLQALFVGAIVTIVKCMEYSDLARHQSQALASVRTRMMQIENTPYAQVFATYHDTNFTAAGLNGLGKILVDDSDPSLLTITTTFCWRERSGRVIGEDSDLDGVLDAGEDKNANGRIDSSVQIVTRRYNI